MNMSEVEKPIHVFFFAFMCQAGEGSILYLLPISSPLHSQAPNGSIRPVLLRCRKTLFFSRERLDVSWGAYKAFSEIRARWKIGSVFTGNLLIIQMIFIGLRGDSKWNALISCRYFVNMSLYRHLSSLKADSQPDRPPGDILPIAKPRNQANAGDDDRVGADVELEAAAERTEMVEPQDVVLIPEII